jgi:hypothetical protein
MTRDEWRRIGIAAVVTLAVGAVLYFGGRWQERRIAASDRAERVEEVEAARSDLARSRGELAAAEDRIRLLRARSLLFETAVDLDRRNFGTANQHLRAASQQLEAVRTGPPSMDVAGLRALQRSIAEANLNVATDLGVQRAQVMDFLARLDALLPEERPEAGASVRADPEAPDTAPVRSP